MKKFAVILSGCGVYDGSEIHEAVLTLLAIDKNGATYEIFAPDIDQHHTINHLTGKVTTEVRNVLVESARIARGNIKSLELFDEADFDALIFPGGFGAAKNLSTFAFKGAACDVNVDVGNAVLSMVERNKPVGAMCIAPAVIAKILHDVDVSIGSNVDEADQIKKMGARHFNSEHGDVIKDKKLKVFSTPCYNIKATISQVATDADNIVKAMLNNM